MAEISHINFTTAELTQLFNNRYNANVTTQQVERALDSIRCKSTPVIARPYALPIPRKLFSKVGLT